MIAEKTLLSFCIFQAAMVILVAGYRTYLDRRSVARLKRLEELQEELKQMDREEAP